MSAIRWEDPFYVNLTTGEVSEQFQLGSVAVPQYGTYGGPFNPDPSVELLTKHNGDPLSYKQLVKFGDATQDPIGGIIDYYFYVHDVELANAGPGYTTEHATADIHLLEALTVTDSSYDAEASLYDALATIGMLGRLLINDQLDLISPSLLLAAVTDAASDLEYALQNLPADEQLLALQTIFGPSVTGIYDLNFTFPSISGVNAIDETIEFFAVSSVAAAINEPGDISLPSGPDDYILRFNVWTSDLDILVA